MNYFFHSSIKNYTIALLDLFNDIRVPRYASDGTRISDATVPIKFGNRDKAYVLSDHDIENINNGNVNFLPRMIIQFDSLTKAGNRDTNKNHKIYKKAKNSDIDTLLYEYHYNAVAYDFYFTLHIATRTFSDATIIIEQIAPMFRPDISVKIFELDLQEEPTTVPIRLGDFDVTLPELDPDEIRIIEVLEPMLNQHKLVIDKDTLEKDFNALSKYSFTFQLSHITKERDCLQHDDRLDALANACIYLLDDLVIDENKKFERLSHEIGEENLRLTMEIFKPFYDKRRSGTISF
jgi:hypothetical protein